MVKGPKGDAEFWGYRMWLDVISTYFGHLVSIFQFCSTFAGCQFLALGQTVGSSEKRSKFERRNLDHVPCWSWIMSRSSIVRNGCNIWSVGEWCWVVRAGILFAFWAPESFRVRRLEFLCFSILQFCTIFFFAMVHNQKSWSVWPIRQEFSHHQGHHASGKIATARVSPKELRRAARSFQKVTGTGQKCILCAPKNSSEVFGDKDGFQIYLRRLLILRTIRTQPRIRKRLLNRASGFQRKPSLCKVLVVVVLSYLPSGRSGWTLTEIVNSGPSHCWVYHGFSISSLDLSGGSHAIPNDLHHFTLSIILSFHFLFFGAIVAPPLAAPPFLKVWTSLNEFERQIISLSPLNHPEPNMTSIHAKVLERKFGSAGHLRLPLHSYFTCHLDAELRIAARLHMKTIEKTIWKIDIAWYRQHGQDTSRPSQKKILTIVSLQGKSPRPKVGVTVPRRCGPVARWALWASPRCWATAVRGAPRAAAVGRGWGGCGRQKCRNWRRGSRRQLGGNTTGNPLVSKHGNRRSYISGGLMGKSSN